MRKWERRLGAIRENGLLRTVSRRATSDARHAQDQSRHLFGLIQLHEVLRAFYQKELRGWEELMKRLRDAGVQRRVGVAEDDPDGSSKRPQLGDVCRA